MLPPGFVAVARQQMLRWPTLLAHGWHLALLRAVAEGAAKGGVEVGVCGELAGTVAGAKLLTGIGIYELSMDPAAIDEVREGLLGT